MEKILEKSWNFVRRCGNHGNDGVLSVIETDTVLLLLVYPGLIFSSQSYCQAHRKDTKAVLAEEWPNFLLFETIKFPNNRLESRTVIVF